MRPPGYILSRTATKEEVSRPLADQHWHALPAEEVVDLLETDAQRGLDLFSIQHRLEQFGPNQLTPPKGTSDLVRFLRQFLDPLVLILLAAGVVTLFLRDWVDAGVIIGVVLLNAAVGYIQEAKAVAAIEALRGTMQAEATVVRSGEQQRLPSTELIPGDLVLLQAGDKVPADLRLLQERELRVDESALTGESVPVDKDAGAVARDCPLAERVSLAFASSLATNGTASGVVVATGDATEVGRISQLISSAEDLKTPLTRKIEEFSKTLLWIILALGGVTFVVGLLRGEGFTEMFKASIALAVAAIPEGLPAAVTITLAIGVGRMAKRRAIIRKLPAVETLGSTTVICSDKTGTLTQNQMTVRALVAGGVTYDVTGTGYAPEGGVQEPDGEDGENAALDRAAARRAALQRQRPHREGRALGRERRPHRGRARDGGAEGRLRARRRGARTARDWTRSPSSRSTSTWRRCTDGARRSARAPTGPRARPSSTPSPAPTRPEPPRWPVTPATAAR